MLMNILTIKLVAYLTMLLDHVGYMTHDTPLRMIGRLSFPLFCFMMAEGARHTSHLYKYLTRVLIMGLLSEIPYNYAFWGKIWHPESQNVMFTLALGLMAIAVIRSLLPHERLWWSIPLPVAFAALAADMIHSDYGAWGVLLIVGLFLFYRRSSLVFAIVTGLGMLAFAGRSVWLAYPHVAQWSMIQMISLAALPFMLLYNGKKGPTPRHPVAAKLMQYGFYLFYPVHLIVLGLIYH
jgi:hypothetical protein